MKITINTHNGSTYAVIDQAYIIVNDKLTGTYTIEYEHLVLTLKGTKDKHKRNLYIKILRDLEYSYDTIAQLAGLSRERIRNIVGE